MLVLPRRYSLLVFSVLAVVLILVTLPYIYAAQSVGSGAVFGGFLLNPLDGNSYLAKMYEGWRGDWRFTLPYSAQSGKGAYLFLFYLFLGHLAGALGFSLPLTFHFARLLGALALLLALLKFYSTLMPDPKRYVLAFVLSALGSGMGWLAVPFGAFTSDFWVAEAYPFLSAYASPHFSFGLALLLWIFSMWVNRGHRLSWSGWPLGVAALALAIVSPFGVVVALVVLGGLLAWELWPSLAREWFEGFGRRLLASANPFFWVLLGGGPLMLYDLWIARSDPLLAGWNAQNLTPSPPLWDLVLSFSPLIALALPGAWVVWKRGQHKLHLLLAWSVLGLGLLYVPFELQRRFMLGIFIPLAGLAALGLEKLSGENLQRARFLAVIALILMLPTNLLVLLAARHGIQTRDPMLYLTRGEVDAFAWLVHNTPSDSLILAAPETGLFIPAYSGRRVIYGHPFETVNAGEEKAWVTRFFEQEASSLNPDQAINLLVQRKVNYIFVGPRERELGGLPFITNQVPVYSSEGISIYALPG